MNRTLSFFRCSSAQLLPAQLLSTTPFIARDDGLANIARENIARTNVFLPSSPRCNRTRPIELEISTSETFSVRVERWASNAETFTFCPELAADSPIVGNQVPNVLHRIWEYSDIPEKYASPLVTWDAHSSGLVVLLRTEKLRKEYISKVLGPEKLDLYNRLKPGSYRADLFKYIITYHVGGIYSDLDAYLHTDLDTVETLTEGAMMAIDLNPSRLLPGAFFMATPKQPVFICAMGEVFDHSEQRTYFGSDISGSLDISGPGVLGECVRHMLGKDDLKFRPGKEQLSTIYFRFLHSYVREDDGVHVVQLDDGVELVSLQAGGQSYERQVSQECDPGEHYSKLYDKKEVYRPGHS